MSKSKLKVEVKRSPRPYEPPYELRIGSKGSAYSYSSHFDSLDDLVLLSRTINKFAAQERKKIELLPEAVIKMMDKGETVQRAWRKHLKMSQVKVAEALDMSQSAVSQIEMSKTLHAETKEKLCRLFGIKLEQLEF